MVSLKSVALPVEHGGWGMLGEPLLLGVLLAPSQAGLGIAVAAIAAFLARHPLKLALADRRRGQRHPRTPWAEGFAAVYAALALAGGALAFQTAPLATWVPLLAALPLGAAQVWYDARHQGRQLAPELLGAVALGSVAAAMMLAAGWEVALAWTAWALIALKSVASVLYVRARLRLDRGQPTSSRSAVAVHAGALGTAGALAWLGWAPWLAVLAFGALLARCARGVSSQRRVLRPQQLGWRELAYGLATVAFLALGYVAGT